MKKKNVALIIIIAIAIIGWFVAAHFFGPDSEYGISQSVSSLQRDSIALQGNFTPRGEYVYLQDVVKEVDDIKVLGDPLRFGHTKTDSAQLFGNPRTAVIANYNIAKCDSVLRDVLPMWRSTAAFALGSELKSKNQNTIVRFNKDAPTYTCLEIYSIRYISKDEIDSDANAYNQLLASLGFTSVRYSVSPESEWTEFSLVTNK